MKKIIALLLTMVLVFSTVGCSEKNDIKIEDTVFVEEDVSTADGHMIALYVPNEEATGFICNDLEIPDLTISNVFATLTEAGVLNEGVIANSLEVTGNQLFLDVNDVFVSQLNGYGTAGEYYTMGSVVNTLLTAYQAVTVYITVNGKTLETGSNIYDFPLEFYQEN